MTLAGISKTIDQSKIDSMAGQAMGISANVSKGGGVDYLQNAMYSEMSKQQSTTAKIKTQGGIASAVTADVAEASLKAAKQQKGTQAEIQQQVVNVLSKQNTSASKEDINSSAGNIAKAIMQGGEGLSSKLESAISGSSIKVDSNSKISDMATMATASAGALAGSLMGGKTAKDIQAVDKANTIHNSNGYIDAKRREGASAGTQDAKQNQLVDTQSATQSIVDKEREQQAEIEKDTGKKGLVEKFDKAAAELGLVETNEDGSVKYDSVTNKPIATTGDKFAMGRAGASANNALMENAVNIGGTVFRESFNADGEGTVAAALGDNSKYDTTSKAEKGTIVKTHLGDPNNFNEANAMEIADILTSPKKLGSLIFGKTYDGVKSTFEELGFESETAGAIANTVAYGASGIVAGGATAVTMEAAQLGYNKFMGNREPVLDKNGKPVVDTSKPIKNSVGDKEFKDVNGNKVFQDAESGKYYSQGKDGEIKPHSGEKLTQSFEPKTRVKKGFFGNALSGSVDTLSNISEKLTDSSVFNETSSDTTKEPPNPTDQDSDKKRPNTEHKNGTHSDLLNKDMDNLTKNKQNLQEQMKEIGGEKQKLASQYKDGKISKSTFDQQSSKLDTKQLDVVNQLEDVDNKMAQAETDAKVENKQADSKEARTKSAKTARTMEKVKAGMGKVKTGGKFAGPIAFASAIGYTLFGGTDAEGASLPNVNPEKALDVAQKQFASEKQNPLTKPQNSNLPKSGTVLDNPTVDTALEDTTNHLGIAALATTAAGFASKTVARAVPGVGAAFAVADTANRTNKGDYLGAGMSALMGVTSSVPVVGTAATLAIAGAQATTDYMGITGGDAQQPTDTQTNASTNTPSDTKKTSTATKTNSKEGTPVVAEQSFVDENGIVDFKSDTNATNVAGATSTPNVVGATGIPTTPNAPIRF